MYESMEYFCLSVHDLYFDIHYVWRDYLSKPEALQSLRPAWNSTKKSAVQGQSEHSAIPVADLEHEVTPSTP